MISKEDIVNAIEEMILAGDTQVNLSCLESYFYLERGRISDADSKKIEKLFTPYLIVKVLKGMKPPKRNLLFQIKDEDVMYDHKKKSLFSWVPYE